MTTIPAQIREQKIEGVALVVDEKLWAESGPLMRSPICDQG